MASNNSTELPIRGTNGASLPTNDQPTEDSYDEILDFDELEPLEEKAKSTSLNGTERQAALDELQAKWDHVREAVYNSWKEKVRCDVCGGSLGYAQGNEKDVLDEGLEHDIGTMRRKMEESDVEKFKYMDLADFLLKLHQFEEWYFATNAAEDVILSWSEPGDEHPIADCDGPHGVWEEDSHLC